MSQNTTSIPSLEVGDRIKDNDPRMPHRHLVIQSINDTHAVAKDSVNRNFKIRRSAIFLDEKVRRTGFTRVGPSA